MGEGKTNSFMMPKPGRPRRSVGRYPWKSTRTSTRCDVGSLLATPLGDSEFVAEDLPAFVGLTEVELFVDVGECNPGKD